MTRYTQTVYDEFDSVYQRCSACGFKNMLGRTPAGGRYTPSSTITYTDSVTGKNFYADAAAANGCAFCGCPIWNAGGSLGDMARSRF
jgi:hypothetical protein